MVKFQAEGVYKVGFVPMWMVSGDFKGDGVLDLAVSNLGSSNVSVLLGNGDGTFKKAKNYPVRSPGNLVPVDLNHDSILDLIVTDGKSLTALLGNGDGTFHYSKSVWVGVAASQTAAADVNGDGNIDLAFTTVEGLGICLGNGGGTFQKPQSFLGGNYPNFLSVANFNDAGKPDAVVTGASGGRWRAESHHLAKSDHRVKTRSRFSGVRSCTGPSTRRCYGNCWMFSAIPWNWSK